MLDYLFFDAGLAQRFLQSANDLKAACRLEETPEGGIQVRVRQSSLDDASINLLDEIYDELFFVEQAKLVEDQGGLADACGVQLQLSSGEFTQVLLAPQIMNRLLSVLTPTELQQLFSQVADAVENPQDHQCSVCHFMQPEQLD